MKSVQFRTLLYMTKNTNSSKLGIIKTYIKRRDSYNLLEKEDDVVLEQDKEALDLHLAVVDLITACARNSPYGIAQAQKLIDIEELLDSLLSDAVPYLVKRHYFCLLYEVYLRKVQGLDQSQRLQITDMKFMNVLEYVVQHDLDNCFIYFGGLVIDFAGDEIG